MKQKFLYLKLFFVTLALNLPPYCLAADPALDSYLGKSKNYEDVLVKEVLSADTIKLENDEVIYLIGLVAPEGPKKHKEVERDEHGFVIPEPVDPATPIEEQAFAFVQKLLNGKHVRLEFDIDRKNKEFRTQAYVFLLDNNALANAEILRQGYAQLRIQPPNLKYADQLRQAYKEARQEKRGLQGE